MRCRSTQCKVRPDCDLENSSKLQPLMPLFDHSSVAPQSQKMPSARLLAQTWGEPLEMGSVWSPTRADKTHDPRPGHELLNEEL